MKLSVIKTDGVFLPAGEEATESMKSVENGKELVIEFHLNRNPAFHRKAFALLNTIFDNQDGFTNIKLFRAWITMKAGYVITGYSPKGTLLFLPESLAYEKMLPEVFEKWYSDVINVAIAEYGMDEEMLNRILSFA